LQNRWVDKPTQFIVFDNAQAGIMGEHSVMDGTPTARLCDEILDYLQNPAFDHGLPSPASPPPPTPMDWHVSPNITSAISAANQAAVDLIESQSLGYVLTPYGKAAIKKFNVSPDSWAQMLIQLAYTRLLSSQNQKRIGGTYEAATTRRFYKGRTEAIRVVSVESDRWAKSMDDENVGLVERKRLFGEAVKKHLALAKGSGMGLGVDRLMFGRFRLCSLNHADGGYRAQEGSEKRRRCTGYIHRPVDRALQLLGTQHFRHFLQTLSRLRLGRSGP
jgi:carnitine O-acetyltransferase